MSQHTLPLNTSMVFDEKALRTEYGECWSQYCAAENLLAQHLYQHPIGTVASSPDCDSVVHFLWPNRDIADNQPLTLALYTAPIVQSGDIDFEQAFCRFDVGMEYGQCEQSALLHMAKIFNQYENHTLKSIPPEIMKAKMEED